nr:DUF4388 domain-containing protein [Ktedonosporobacter rubrisoli]
MFNSQRRGFSTERLRHIIQVIQLGRKTGLLTVERGEDMRLEEGEISFVQGYITHARCGQLNGQPALDRLNTWGECRFKFFSPTTDGISGLLPAVRTSTGPLPAIQTPTSPLPAIQTPTSPLPAIQTPTSPLPAIQTPTSPLQETNPYLRTPANMLRNMQENNAARASNSSPPRRIRQVEEAISWLNQAGLSRTHRHIFLLVDGNRTVPELARLIGRRPDEIERLLRDLERIGIIQ